MNPNIFINAAVTELSNALATAHARIAQLAGEKAMLQAEYDELRKEKATIE